MKFRVTIGDGIDLLVEADKEVEAVRKAKTVRDAMKFNDSNRSTVPVKDSYAFGNTGWATNSNYSPDVLNGYLEQIRICLGLKDIKGAERAKKDIVEYIANSRKYQSELKKSIEKVEQGFKHIESELSKLM